MQYTAPYTPEQNGLAEGYMQTLIELVRTTLSETKLDQALWAHLIRIKNMSPSRAHLDVRPFEAWHGKRPDFSNGLFFGQRYSVLVDCLRMIISVNKSIYIRRDVRPLKSFLPRNHLHVQIHP